MIVDKFWLNIFRRCNGKRKIGGKRLGETSICVLVSLFGCAEGEKREKKDRRHLRNRWGQGSLYNSVRLSAWGFVYLCMYVLKSKVSLGFSARGRIYQKTTPLLALMSYRHDCSDRPSIFFFPRPPSPPSLSLFVLFSRSNEPCWSRNTQ